jgi:drug/metabolite transporter (DMT)-like permease
VTSQPAQRESVTEPLGVAGASLAIAAWAASAVLAKGIDLSGVIIVFWRMWLYVVLIVGVQYALGRPLRWSDVKLSWWGGIALGLDMVGFFTAVKLTTVANATVIGSLQPLLLLFVVGRFFGERPRRSDYLLSAVAFLGVLLVLFGSAGLPAWSPRGDLIAFLVLFAWTGYLVASKLVVPRIGTGRYSAATAVVATLFATPFAAATGDLGDLPTRSEWVGLVALAIVPGFLGHFLMNWSLARIPLWLGSTLTLLIPVTSTVLAWVFLDEQVVAMQFVGMAVVVVALGGIVLGQGQRHGPELVVDAEEGVVPAPGPLEVAAPSPEPAGPSADVDARRDRR